MARNRSLVPLVLVAALALAIGAVLWLAFGSSDVKETVAVDRGGAVIAADTDRPRAGEVALDKEKPAAPAIESAVVATPKTDVRSEVTELDDRELASAIWVEGSVHFPQDTPTGEVVEITADGKKFEHRADFVGRVDANGRFRVAFSKDTKTAWLRLDAPHLYADPLKLKLSELTAQIVIEPLVGAEITGVIAPPAGATGVAEVLKHGQVRMYGWTGNGGDSTQRTSKVDETGRFDLRGIPPHPRYQLSYDAGVWAPISRDDLHVEAGQTMQLDLVATFGARVSGKVVDASGAAMYGVELNGQITKVGDDKEFVGYRPGKVEKDGTFAITGIQPGKFELVANKQGFLEERVDLGALADGDVRENLIVELDAGSFVAGKVTWPDGKPAANAMVRVVEPKREEEQRSMGFRSSSDDNGIKVAADGTFKISGLHAGPYEVTAQAKEGSRELGDDGAPNKMTRNKGPLWRARAADVAANREGLALVLQPGLSVAGRVVDDTGAPVKSFSLSATKASEEDRFRYSNNDPNAVTSRFDDDDGRFEFAGLGEGSWSITAKAKGLTDSDPVLVKLPGDGAPLAITLSRCASLSGVVVDSAGKPIAKASIEIERDRNRQFPSFVDSQPRVTTNAKGEFTVSSAPSGSIRLIATEGRHAKSKALHLDVAAGQKIADLSLVMTAGGTIRGEMHASLGSDLSGWSVTMSSMDGENSDWNSAETDATGKFVFEHVTPGEHQVQAYRQERHTTSSGTFSSPTNPQPSERVTVREGETAHVVLGSPPKAPVRVVGTVTRAGKPAADVMVYAWKEQQPTQAKTGADGRYELVVDGGGECHITVGSESGGTHTSRRVDLPEASTYTLDFELASGRIAGRVVDSDGKPLENAMVQLNVERDQAALSGTGTYGYFQTKADGAFTFDNLGAGVYRVTAGDSRYGFNGANSQYGETSVGDLNVEEGASIADVVIRLERAAVLTGVVRTASGAPAVSAFVTVRDARGASRDQWVGRHTTDGAGRYRIDDLSAGTWTVSAQLGNEASDESAPVRVASGDSTTVDLSMRAATRLRISVLDRDGKRVGASISVRDSKGREHGSSFVFDPDFPGGEGSYTIGPLPPGKYDVTATNHDKSSASSSVSLHGEADSSVELRFGGE